mmetsp:Transcript_13593/g.17163  ORF Transcript_13593/g.17163 Transcript_13593/m.17163 type:complete len:97 (-) Transcript_13593:418-708(-)
MVISATGICSNFARYKISTSFVHRRRFKFEYSIVPASTVINLKPHCVSLTRKPPHINFTAVRKPHRVIDLESDKPLSPLSPTTIAGICHGDDELCW